MTDVVYRYKPAFEGQFIPGIPARDLTAADVERLAPFFQRELDAAGPAGKRLYERVKPAAPTTTTPAGGAASASDQKPKPAGRDGSAETTETKEQGS